MKNLKRSRFFSLGRKWVFTLALFLLVFGVASVVKIHAAGNVTGWLWGGNEDASLAPPALMNSIDGNETGVGWISMNNVNPEIVPSGADSYGVTVPSGDGAISGYAWSENIGWISFNSGDLVGCAGASGARREGHYIKGWARILSIRDAAGNSGGWLGCIKLSSESGDPVPYGVDIDKMLGTGSGSHTYAWSNELGWIDFGQANVEEVCSLEFSPASKTMNENSSGTVVLSEIGTKCQCKNMKIESTNASAVDGVAPAAVNFFADIKPDSANISFDTKSVGATTTFNGVVKASSDNCGEVLLNLIVQNVPDCHITCPDSVEVAPGGAAENIEIESTGTECGGLAVTSCSGSASNIMIDGPTSGNCIASASSAATFKDSTTATVSTNVGSCSTKVFVKRLGWVETNP